MSFYQTLDQDFKSALKDRDELRVSVQRMLRTALKNKEVELRRKLEDKEILGVIQNQAKQRRDSIEQFSKGGRLDLVEKEKAELLILEAYLPQQMSREEIEAAVKALIAELDATSVKEMGRVMKTFMERYKGQADGKLVGDLVKKALTTQ